MATLRARTVVDDNRQRVVVVESLAINREDGAPALWLFVRLEPIAVVIRDASGTQAFDTNAEPADLDKLLGNVEGLGALLEP